MTQDDQALLDALKALANPTRLAIMRWLRDPDANFPPVDAPREHGVCLKQIYERAGVSQSTASQFMAVLQRARLVRSRRAGQWTYYERDEEQIAALTQRLGASL
jgi:ArsR family transcriptional regulator